MPGNGGFSIADDVLADVGAETVCADQACALVAFPGFGNCDDAFLCLPEINDARAGNQPYPVVATTAVEQGIEQITAVDHRVRVAEAFAERVLDRDIGNHLVTDEIHQDEAIDKNRAIENSVAYPQHIERLEGIRCELDTGANLAELARLFEHGRRNARLRQRKRSREAADATTGDQDVVATIVRAWHRGCDDTVLIGFSDRGAMRSTVGSRTRHGSFSKAEWRKHARHSAYRRQD